MIRSLWTAATGMQGQSTNIDVIANNIANVNTAGFKKSRVDFQDLLYDTLRSPGVASSQSTQVPTGVQLGHGARVVAVTKLFSPGEFQNTKNELDLAIVGQGFFQVLLPEGETAYTKAGNFSLDSEGRIVTPDGFLLEPEIAIPTDTIAISVGMDGTVSVMEAGESDATEVGTIELARFVNSAGLRNIGKNLFLPSNASGDAITGAAGQDGLGYLEQGYLEMSNVSVVDEMVNMITAHRAYELNSKIVMVADEMLSMSNNVKR
ncbi:MAG: flagellar basal-body rod protein FlgG [Desulfobacterales bacterium]|nr:MAG: flagellar basal-body rod protein FlgG [Desulfobacterales bacterium]